jgi:hypothetical protein
LGVLRLQYRAPRELIQLYRSQIERPNDKIEHLADDLLILAMAARLKVTRAVVFFFFFSSGRPTRSVQWHPTLPIQIGDTRIAALHNGKL